MRLYIFGTCSGTQPFPGRHHVSFAIESGGGLYWFDAGENCSYTACCMGVDLMKIRKIIISHTHMDHIGGLGNLLWNIRKINGITKGFEGCSLDLFIPEIKVWNGLRDVLSFTEGGFNCNFGIDAHEYEDGVLFNDGCLKVTALHNHHLQKQLAAGDRWRSFGFLIEAEGKSIIYSGDTGGLYDLEPLLLPKRDILLMETGHHDPTAFSQELFRHPGCPDRLLFIHHGRQILDNFSQVNQEVKAIFGSRAEILSDKTILEL